MRIAILCTSLAMVMALFSGGNSGAADKKDPSAPVTAEPKMEPRQSAATIDFARELGLDFPSLATLGSRIEQARLAPDPVCLANAARELAVAENISKKTAPLTAEAILKEAIETVKLRRDSKELLAVAMMDGTAATKELVGMAKEAAEWEEKAAAAAKANEASRAIKGDLTVHNTTGNHVHVYYNGREVGRVNAHSSKRLHIHDIYGDEHFTVEVKGHNGYYKYYHKDQHYTNATITLR